MERIDEHSWYTDPNKLTNKMLLETQKHATDWRISEARGRGQGQDQPKNLNACMHNPRVQWGEGLRMGWEWRGGGSMGKRGAHL